MSIDPKGNVPTTDKRYFRRVHYPSIGSQQSAEAAPGYGDARRSNPDVLLFERVMEAVERNTMMIESGLMIPQLMRESALDATGNATSLTLTPQSSNVFLVKQVVTFVPSGQSGLLVLAEIQIPVGPGTTSMRWYQALNPDDIRQLSVTGAGTLSVVLMGEQMSRRNTFH